MTRAVQTSVFLLLSALLIYATLTGVKLYKNWSQSESDSSHAALTAEAPAGEIKLIDGRGEAFQLDQLKGKIVVANVMFTSCQFECKTITNLVRDMLFKQYPDVHFLSITCDPDNDQSGKLRAYAIMQGEDSPRWSFVTGKMRDIREVTYHVFGERVERGRHRPYLAIVDRDGNLVKLLNYTEMHEIIHELDVITGAKPRPPEPSDDDSTGVQPVAAADSARPL